MKPLFLLLLLLTLQACQFSSEPSAGQEQAEPPVESSRSYHLTQKITLSNEGQRSPDKHNLWVALISDQPPFQEVISRTIQPEQFVVVSDEYDNQYAEFDLKQLPANSDTQITINYEVIIHELTYELRDCQGELPDTYNQSELHIESNNPQIVSLADQLSSPAANQCEMVRNFYNYLGDNLIYTYNGEDWGAQAALGEMGADCSEYSSLLIALSRAKGIPARYIEGILFLSDNQAPQARQEHAWVEVFLPGTGWVPVDPTLGRSTLAREEHFARYSPNHIIVSRGRNPSTLRGASYWTHLYWPGDSTNIRTRRAQWTITPGTSGQLP